MEQPVTGPRAADSCREQARRQVFSDTMMECRDARLFTTKPRSSAARGAKKTASRSVLIATPAFAAASWSSSRSSRVQQAAAAERPVLPRGFLEDDHHALGVHAGIAGDPRDDVSDEVALHFHAASD